MLKCGPNHECSLLQSDATIEGALLSPSFSDRRSSCTEKPSTILAILIKINNYNSGMPSHWNCPSSGEHILSQNPVSGEVLRSEPGRTQKSHGSPCTRKLFKTKGMPASVVLTRTPGLWRAGGDQPAGSLTMHNWRVRQSPKKCPMVPPIRREGWMFVTHCATEINKYQEWPQ